MRFNGFDLTKAEHQLFTNAWRQLIPYGSVGISKAAIMSFAQEIYKNHPALLRALGL